MSGILSSLLMSAGAMRALDRALQVTQNNVANASTPGYAEQSQLFIAMPADPAYGAIGGVRLGEVESARDEFSEQAVRNQTLLLGEADQNVSSLTSLQMNLDISGNSGLPKALNNLFQAFSAWGQRPNDSNTRQTVIDRAGQVADAFRQAASGLAKATADNEQQLQQTVAHVNSMVAQLAQYNTRVLGDSQHDAGLDAQIHATLEQLSRYVPFTAMKQANGSFTVLLNGQTPLLIGTQQYGIAYSLEGSTDPSAPYPQSPASAHIRAYDGADVTSGIAGGQLGALLDIRNQLLPSYIGSSQQQGDLNVLAQQFATRVNDLLRSGTLADGTSPGFPLFTFDTISPTNVAATLTVSTGITPDQLAASLPGPPVQSNGVALALSGLADPRDPADKIAGQSYTQFYAAMASRVGSALDNATSEQQIQQGAVAQAQNLRQQRSGVDLNEEAMRVIEFQRAYEANARLITVLDRLTEDTINIVS